MIPLSWPSCTETGKYKSNTISTYRAFANLKMENFGLTQADSDKALELDPTYIKAYYRKGSAHMVLQKYQDALADFKKVVDALPNDKDAKKKYLECRRGLFNLLYSI